MFFIEKNNTFVITLKHVDMGGNALKNTFTERKTTELFNLIAKDVLYGINTVLYYESHIIKCYHTKETHGDMDVLIKIPPNNDNQNIINFIKNHYKPNEMIKNGNVISFDYQQFQIDFILINEINWSIAKHYFDYDCCGNVMGKTFHKFGLSYGWEGLFYKFRNFHGSNSQDILLTNDVRKIFDFGGYDYNRYIKGFETLEEIFNFCIDSKYFDTEMFQMENLKSIDRKRNRKRGSYHLFLNYLKDNVIKTKYQFEADKDIYLPKIAEYFIEAALMEELEALKEVDRKNKIISQKFNGDMVMQWLPNLQGKELGAAMGKFKSAVGDEFDEFILQSDYETIHNYFMKVYNDRTDS